MSDLVPSTIPEGADPAANAELAKVWKIMGEKMQQLANKSETGYDENLSPQDVIRNLNAVQAAADEKDAKWGRIRQIFNTTLDAVSKVGGLVASAASNVSLIDVSQKKRLCGLPETGLCTGRPVLQCHQLRHPRVPKLPKHVRGTR